jgi:hypothetical protein
LWKPYVPQRNAGTLYISNRVDGTDDDMLWNGSEEDGMSRVRVMQMKVLIMKMETVTLFSKAESDMLCVLVYEIILKYFFLRRRFIFGGLS